MIEVDGKKIFWSEGMTLAALVKQMDQTRVCAVVRLNGKLISSPDFDRTVIPDTAVIQLLPLVAGG